jgi:hypothetical protein
MEAKFIYERLDFERGVDPREALNIGIEGRLRNWLKKKKGLDFDKTKLETILHYAAMDNQVDFVKYLMDVKKAPVTDGALNVAFANKVDDEIIMYLISKGDQGIINFIESKKKKKARTVRESLNFERGLDPKDSLKIGIRNKRHFKTVRECAQFFLDNIDKLSEGRFKNKEELKNAFQQMDKSNKPGNPSLPSEKSPLRMSKDYLDGFIERDAKGETLDHKYPPIYIDEWGTDFSHLLQKLQGLRDFHIDLQRILGIHKEKIQESLDFERGLDPKEAIGIGQEELNKKRAEEIGDIAQVPAGKYRVFLSGFSGRSKYRTVKDMGEDIWVSKQWARKNDIGFEVFPKELEERNKKWQKRNPGSSAYFFIDPEERIGIKESQNFERGMDPKVAMEIGWKARVINWFNEPHAFEDFYNGFYDLLPKKINRFTTDHWLIKNIAKFVGHSGKDEITPEQFTDLLAIILYSNAGKESDEVFKFSKFGDINDYDNIIRDGHLDSKIDDWAEDGALTDPNKFKKKLEAFPNDMYEDVQYEEEKAAEEEKTNKRISN